MTWQVGNGRGISFWFDSWGEDPIQIRNTPRRIRPHISLRIAKQAPQTLNLTPQQTHNLQALTLTENLTPQQTHNLQALTLTERRDIIRWKWTSHGQYTAKSVYRTIMGEGRAIDSIRVVWKYKIPQTVKIFSYLLLKGKILTRDVLQQRN